jgi:hypothetical protein
VRCPTAYKFDNAYLFEVLSEFGPHNLEEFVMILHFKVNPQSHLKYILVGFHVSSTFGIEHFFSTINHYLSWLYIYIWRFPEIGDIPCNHLTRAPHWTAWFHGHWSRQQGLGVRRIAGYPETVAFSNGDELMNQRTKW